MKTICILSGYFNRYDLTSKSQGGAEYQNHLLKNELEKIGYNVFFIAVGDNNEVYTDSKTTIYYLKKKKFSRKFGNNFFLYIPAIYRILKQLSPDIVYQRTSMAWTGIAAFYARKYNKKFIWAIGSEEDVVQFKIDKLQNLLFNYIDYKIALYGKKNCTAIIAQADYQKELLLKNYDLKTDAVIKNYHPSPEEKIHKDPNRLEVVWIANFSENKCPEKFVEIAKYFKENKKIHFTMVGRPYSNEKQKIIERSILDCENLDYLGNLLQSEVNLILSKTNILVNTSDFEGFSNVFIQAMLRENIVLSLNSNPDNILENNSCGFCANGDLQKLINHIKLFCNNKKLLFEMEKNAYNYAISNHLISNQINKIIQLFNR